MGKPSYNLKECQEYALFKKGKCLSTEYKNNYSKMTWECEFGYKWDAIWSAIKRNHWCPHCAGRAKVTVEDGHKLATFKKGFFLSKNIIKNKDKCHWKCEFNHNFWMRYNDVQQGQWCPVCSNHKKHDLFWCKKLATDQEGECLATFYTNNKMKYEWKCKKGHTWKTTPHNINSGQWCPMCSCVCSKAQLEIFEFMNKIYPDATSRQKGLLIKQRRELDIWIPSLRIGIEYDGDYWHSPRFKHFRSNDDIEKNQMCDIAGIKLFRVSESSYIKNKFITLLQLLIQIQLYANL